MTGEMSKSEVTRESYPAFFRLKDEIRRRYNVNVTVEPWDQYWGPYVLVDHKVKVWAGREFQPHGVRNPWMVEWRGDFKEVNSGKGVYQELDKIFSRKLR